MTFKVMRLSYYGSTYLVVTLFVSVLTFIIATGQVALGQKESSPLKGMSFSEATEAYSDGGILEATIVIEVKQGLVANQSFSALVYNGSLLGPTLHIKPGERMVVNYVNKLDQPTNLHFHGLHVSPSGSSDNVFRVVGPGETAKYVIDIPIEGLEDLLPNALHNITQQTFA